MNIALVSPYDLGRPGGVQQQVLELAAQLVKAGERVWVVAPGVPEDDRGVEIRSVGTSLVVPGNRSRVPVALAPPVVGRTRRAVAGADLVHVHEPLMPLVSLAALAAGPPVVATFHADPPQWVRNLYRRAKGWAERLLAPAEALTAVSPVAAAALPWAGVVVIPNGLDVASYQLDVDRHPTRVVYLGRDDPRKGLGVLLEAWARVRERVPGAELVVVGAERADVPGVSFLGAVSERVKRETLASAAVLAAPNLGGESFGLVVAEGMAAGCAVVASDLPAFRAVLDTCGRRVPPGNSAALGEALIGLLLDPAAREELAAAGRRRVERYDWEVVTGRYRALYGRAAQRWSGQRRVPFDHRKE